MGGREKLDAVKAKFLERLKDDPDLAKDPRFQQLAHASPDIVDKIRAEADDKDLKELVRYIIGKRGPLELGTFHHVFTTAISSKDRGLTSTSIQHIKSFIDRAANDPSYFMDKNRFAAMVGHVVKDYRNPAAHVEVMTREQATAIRDYLIGAGQKLSEFTTALR